MFEIGDEVDVVEGLYRGDYGVVTDGPIDLRGYDAVWVWLMCTSGHLRAVQKRKLAHRRDPLGIATKNVHAAAVVARTFPRIRRGESSR